MVFAGFVPAKPFGVDAMTYADRVGSQQPNIYIYSPGIKLSIKKKRKVEQTQNVYRDKPQYDTACVWLSSLVGKKRETYRFYIGIRETLSHRTNQVLCFAFCLSNIHHKVYTGTGFPILADKLCPFCVIQIRESLIDVNIFENVLVRKYIYREQTKLLVR